VLHVAPPFPVHGLLGAKSGYKLLRLEDIQTHFMFKDFSRNRAVYEIMWKNNVRVGQATDGNIIRRTRIACWIPKATDTDSEYIMVIDFPCNSGYTNAPQCYVIRAWSVQKVSSQLILKKK